MTTPTLRALCLPGCGCRGAFQFGVMRRLWERGERFDVVAGASSGAICGAVTVAGLAPSGPDMFRSLATTPIVSTRYLRSERSPFGMRAIVREALARFVPEDRIVGSESELLVSTTRAGQLLKSMWARARSLATPRGAQRTPAAPTGTTYPFEAPSPVHAMALEHGALVVHSSRDRADMHDIIVASSTIPGLYARLPVVDGEVHVDGGAADNTLLHVLLARGITDITVVTPYGGGAVSPTLFERERPPRVPPHVRLRLIYPRAPIRLRHFDFDRDRLEEALEMEMVEEEYDATRGAA